MKSIKTSFTLIFLALVITSLIVGVWAFYVVERQQQDARLISISEMQVIESHQILDQTLSISMLKGTGKMAEHHKEELAEYRPIFSHNLQALLKGGIATDASGKEIEIKPVRYPKVISALVNVERNWEELDSMVDFIINFDKETDGKFLIKASKDLKAKGNILVNDSKTVVDIFKEESAKSIWFLKVSLIMGVLLTFLFCFAGWYLSQKIVKGIQKVADAITKISGDDLSEQEVPKEDKGEVGQLARAYDQLGRNLRGFLDQANQIAAGDLSIDVDGGGDLANAFKKMVMNLSNLIKDVKRCGGEVKLTSGFILEASNEQSFGSSQQSASISETTATMEELSRTSTQIAQRGENVVKMAGQTLTSVEKGKELTGEVIAGMYKINESSEESARKVLELVEKSQKIGDVIDIINGFAEQTNLLALNASIEAARVGEVGKGFAVVAHEVRNLAENVAESAQEIKDLILEIQSSTNASVMAIDEGTKRVRSGVNLVEEASASFEEILNSAKETTDLAKEIGVASQQQKVASEQVTIAMKEINGVALDFAANTKQTSSSAGQLNQVAEKLAQSMGRFNLGERSEDEQTSHEKVDDNSSNNWKRVDNFEFDNTSENEGDFVIHKREDTGKNLSEL